MFKSILITPQKRKSPIICISVVCCCASTNNLLAPEDHFESSPPEWSVRRHIPHNHSRLKEHFKLVVIACVRRKAKLVALWT